jgi:hypothetical protein
MGDVRFGAPIELIQFLRRTFGVATFVETGTYQGDTTAWASAQFPRVITVERSESLYRRARERHGTLSNVAFLQGDSREMLRQQLRSFQGPAIFWLDAHLCGGETYGHGDECPLLQEIAAIKASGVEAFILVDDARLFLAPPPDHDIAAWPGLQEVAGALSAGTDQGYLAVFEDVILWVPSPARNAVSDFLRGVARREQHARWERQSYESRRLINRLRRRLGLA